MEIKKALDKSVEVAELNRSRFKVQELEFLIFKEKMEVERLEKLVEESRKVTESHRKEARWWKVAIWCLVFFMILFLVFPIFMMIY